MIPPPSSEAIWGSDMVVRWLADREHKLAYVLETSSRCGYEVSWRRLAFLFRYPVAGSWAYILASERVAADISALIVGTLRLLLVIRIKCWLVVVLILAARVVRI